MLLHKNSENVHGDIVSKSTEHNKITNFQHDSSGVHKTQKANEVRKFQCLRIEMEDVPFVGGLLIAFNVFRYDEFISRNVESHSTGNMW